MEAESRPMRTAEQLAEWYCHTLRKAEAAAEEREFLRSQDMDFAEADAREQALLAEVEALQAEMGDKLDACAYVMERYKGESKAHDAQVKHYDELVKAHRAKRERALAVVDRMKVKITALVDADGGKSSAGSEWKATLKGGAWAVVKLDPEAPIPKAAQRVEITEDRKALLALVNADAAPGWGKEQSKILTVTRI